MSSIFVALHTCLLNGWITEWARIWGYGGCGHQGSGLVGVASEPPDVKGWSRAARWALAPITPVREAFGVHSRRTCDNAEMHIPSPQLVNPSWMFRYFQQSFNLCSFGKWCLHPSCLYSPSILLLTLLPLPTLNLETNSQVWVTETKMRLYSVM